MDWSSTCRLCFGKTRGLKKMTQDLLDICRSCLNLPLRVVEQARVCRQCSNFLRDVCDFKLMCLESECQLVDVLEPTLKLEATQALSEEKEPADTAEELLIPKIEPEENLEVQGAEDHFDETIFVKTLEIEKPDELQADEDFEWKESLTDIENQEIDTPELQSFSAEESQAKRTVRSYKRKRPEDYEKCPKCYHRFKNLKNHMIHCERVGPLKFQYASCQVCHKAVRANSMHLHMRVHNTEPCTICKLLIIVVFRPFSLIFSFCIFLFFL